MVGRACLRRYAGVDMAGKVCLECMFEIHLEDPCFDLCWNPYWDPC